MRPSNPQAEDVTRLWLFGVERGAQNIAILRKLINIIKPQYLFNRFWLRQVCRYQPVKGVGTGSKALPTHSCTSWPGHTHMQNIYNKTIYISSIKGLTLYHEQSHGHGQKQVFGATRSVGIWRKSCLARRRPFDQMPERTIQLIVMGLPKFSISWWIKTTGYGNQFPRRRQRVKNRWREIILRHVRGSPTSAVDRISGWNQSKNKHTGVR